MSHRAQLVSAFCCLAALSAPLAAPALAADKDKPAAATSADQDIAKPPVKEQLFTHHDEVSVDGHTIGYTAEAGTLTLRDKSGAPVAMMSYVAYIADGHKHDDKRPVTFLYNGGPGAASLWLNMGSVSPIHVVTPGTGVAGPAPYKIGPNPDTIIDKTDLVYMDAMSTGFSRTLGKGKLKDFIGTDNDINFFRDGILRYLTKFDRWNSPKFLYGESYGTTRSAGLAYALDSAGAPLNGVVLQSSYLNTDIDNPGYDRGHVAYFPSFAATAWYHHKVNTNLSLEDFVQKAREFAAGPYLLALEKGDDISPAEAQKVASEMSKFIGLPADYILKSKLRVDPSNFRKMLLIDEHHTIGRFDARFKGNDLNDAQSTPEYDASDEAINGAYVAAMNQYLFGTLHYKTDMEYRPADYSVNEHWSLAHMPPGASGMWDKMPAAVTTVDLSQAMRQDTHLKVLSLNGYYDFATPFFGTEYDLKHMGLSGALKDNLTFKYYQAGHMVYVSKDTADKLHKDLEAFYSSAVK